MTDSTLLLAAGIIIGLIIFTIIARSVTPRYPPPIYRDDSIRGGIGCLVQLAVIVVGAWLLFGSKQCSPFDWEKGKRAEPVQQKKAPAPQPKKESSPPHKTYSLEPPCDTLSQRIFNACDHMAIRLSVLKAINPDHSGPISIQQICDVYDYVRRRWIYISDPKGEEYISSALESWQTPKGDCEDFAIAVGTGVRAIGGDVTILLVRTPKGHHAYAEVAITESEKDIDAYLEERYFGGGPAAFKFHKRNGTLWLNLDFSAIHPGGPYQKELSGTIIYLTEKRCARFPN